MKRRFDIKRRNRKREKYNKCRKRGNKGKGERAAEVYQSSSDMHIEWAGGRIRREL